MVNLRGSSHMFSLRLRASRVEGPPAVLAKAAHGGRGCCMHARAMRCGACAITGPAVCFSQSSGQLVWAGFGSFLLSWCACV